MRLKIPKNSDVALSFKEDLILSIEESNTDYQPKANYTPSNLKCIRNMWYKMKGFKADPDKVGYQGIGIRDSGTSRHLSLQKVVKSSKFCDFLDVSEYIIANNLDYLTVSYKTEYETHLKDSRYNLSFLVDGLVKYKDKIYILEIKTENSNKFYNQLEVQEDHLNQISCYSLSLNIDKALFVYENRDTLELKVYELDITDDMRYKVINLISTCNEYLALNKVPPKSTNSSDCNYCRYKSICKGVKR